MDFERKDQFPLWNREEFDAERLDALTVALASIAVLVPSDMQARIHSAVACLRALGMERPDEACARVVGEILLGTAPANYYKRSLMVLAEVSEANRRLVISMLEQVSAVYRRDAGSDALIIVAREFLGIRNQGGSG